MRCVLAVVCICLSAGMGLSPAQAHPHMFFDAGAQFLMDGEGRLEAVRVAYVVDEYNSLYSLTELGLDSDGDGALTPEEEKELAGSVKTGLTVYGFYLDLREAGADDAQPLAFGPPRSGAAVLDQGQIAVTFDLPLVEPVDPKGRPLRLRLYDPSYFTAVTMDEAPGVDGDAAGACSVAYKKFDPDVMMAKLQTQLAQLGREETPEDSDIGAQFADEAVLSCEG